MSSNKTDKLTLSSLSKSFFSSLKGGSGSSGKPWRNTKGETSITKTKEITEVVDSTPSHGNHSTYGGNSGLPRSLSMLSLHTTYEVNNDGNMMTSTAKGKGKATSSSQSGLTRGSGAATALNIPVDAFRRSLTHVITTGKPQPEKANYTKRYNDDEPSIVLPVPDNKWWQLGEVLPNREPTTELSLEPDVPIAEPETALIFDGDCVRQVYVRDMDIMEGQHLTQQVEKSKVIINDSINARISGSRQAQKDSMIIKQCNDRDLSGWMAPTEQTKTFWDALTIYETDQSLLVAFLDQTNKSKVSLDERQQRIGTILTTARQLETWFCRYAEPFDTNWSPIDIEEWKNRETQRYNGISGYCDSKLRTFIQRGF